MKTAKHFNSTQLQLYSLIIIQGAHSGKDMKLCHLLVGWHYVECVIHHKNHGMYAKNNTHICNMNKQ